MLKETRSQKILYKNSAFVGKENLGVAVLEVIKNTTKCYFQKW